MMHLLKSNPRSKQRRGLTLVELLVVITILMILMGVVLPLASPSLKGRKIREAARQVNTAFAGAKSRAEGNGQPSGVIIYPNETSNQAYSIAMAKAPNSFRGPLDSSRLTVFPRAVLPGGPRRPLEVVLVDASGIPDPYAATQLMRLLGKNVIPPVNGEFAFQFRLNNRGRWLKCYWQQGRLIVDPSSIRGNERLFDNAHDKDGDGYLSSIETNDANNAGGVDQFVTQGLPFEIQILPKRSAASSITLPTGTHVDLSRSAPTLALGSANPITVMFDKNGLPDRIFRGTTAPIVDDFGLLIVDSDLAADGSTNVLDPVAGSMWVVVDNDTGQVKTTANLGSDLNNDGIYDQILVLDLDNNGVGDTLRGDGNADGQPDDVNGDSAIDADDANAIAQQALFEALNAAKAGGL